MCFQQEVFLQLNTQKYQNSIVFLKQYHYNRVNIVSMSVESVKVLVRVRPLTKKEQESIDTYQTFWEGRKRHSARGKLAPAALAFFSRYHNVRPSEVLKVQSNCVSVCDQQYKNSDGGMRNYVFTGVFGQQSSNLSIFNHSIQSEVSGVFQGLNCTVLAYGITGSGKTFSVFGHPKAEKDRGMCHLAVDYLFVKRRQLQEIGVKVEMRFTFIEIYNENVRDLLSEDGRRPVTIGEDAKGNITLVDASQITVRSGQHVGQLIGAGTARRTSAATQSNLISSRSHAVLRITIEVVREGSRSSGKLFIIDLAGSEKISTDNCMRRHQGTNINRSLLALGNCINALVQNSKKQGTSHIPYRDSKLTRLLKDSLGGGARTIMLACISPHPFTLDQTITTLNYAQRAQGIKKEVALNIEDIRCPRCKDMAICRATESAKAFETQAKPFEFSTGNRVDNPISEQNSIYWDICERLYRDICENAREGQQIERLRGAMVDPCAELQIIAHDNEQQRMHLRDILFGMLREKGKPKQEESRVSARKIIRLSNSSRKHSRDKSPTIYHKPDTERQNKYKLDEENVLCETIDLPLQPISQNTPLFQDISKPKPSQEEGMTAQASSGSAEKKEESHRRRKSKFQIVSRPPLYSGRRGSEQRRTSEQRISLSGAQSQRGW